ncbi:MAG: DUF2177 family protein [Planctomycetota bacterium]|nr:DUF2177 family protein [Planctomycetota bacterium]
MHSLKLFLIVLPIFLMIDLLWLGVIMKNFYSQELGDLARRSGGSLAPRWGAAIMVYLLIPAGILIFVRPLLKDNATFWHALGWGALFGLVVYGVYDLTSLAVIEKWTVRMTIADIAWGCTLCAITSVITWYVDGWLKG